MEQRFDTIPQIGSVSAPVTSLNKLCYDRMREITRKRANNKNVSKLEQTLRAYRDYVVKHI